MQKDISDQLVRLIDILFGLVIVEGALFYRPILAAHDSRNVAAILALVLIMYTVVRSFVDWHVLMEQSPYRIITSSKADAKSGSPRSLQVRTLDLWRLYVDFIIVATYSVMLLRGHVLVGDSAAGLRFFFWTFPAIFVLYLIWGEFLRRSTAAQQFSEWLLLIVLALSLTLAVLYNVAYDLKWLTGHGTWRNAIALGVALLVTMGYRYFNWKQQKTVE